VGIACRRDREIPLGIQLEWGLRSAIVRGELASGERLPPLRELAEDVGAHVNTIRAVYARLEQDGLIDTRHGKGSFVLAQPASAHLRVTTALAVSTQAARDAGLSPEQLAAALYVMPDEQDAPDAEAVARRQLRAEIAVLEGALAALHAEHPELPVGSKLESPRGPRILDGDELRRQRDDVLDRLVTARMALADGTTAEELPATRSETRRAGTAARRRIAPA
jgi:GntR family transcriptional regulator